MGEAAVEKPEAVPVAKVAPAEEQPEDEQVVEKSPRERYLRFKVRSVSYTHLTLPTIYSV